MTTGRGVGFNELTPALQEMIGSGGSGGVVITNKSDYTNTVSYNTQAVVRNIVFVDGVKIVSFNPDADVLTCYKDGALMIEDVDYTINDNNVSIDAVDTNGWVITDGVQTHFTFKVSKNSNSSLGESNQITEDMIADGAITLDKLASDITEELESVKTSVSNGKALVAAAITDKGVETAATDSFQTMSENVSAISTGEGNAQPEHVLASYTFTNGEESGLVGTIPTVTTEDSYKSSNTDTVIIPSGSYISGDVVLKGDSNLVAGNIKSGVSILDIDGTFTADATAVASDILAGKTAGVGGNLITGTITSKAAATYTPSTTNQTISAGQYLSGDQVITGDTNLSAANIKSGSSIFGVNGSFTADATATASKILSGYTAGVNGSMITGTIGSRGAATYTPGASNQTISAGQYLSGSQTILGSSNLVSSNIKSGVKIFNVTGNLTAASLGAVTMKKYTWKTTIKAGTKINKLKEVGNIITYGNNFTIDLGPVKLAKLYSINIPGNQKMSFLSEFVSEYDFDDWFDYITPQVDFYLSNKTFMVSSIEQTNELSIGSSGLTSKGDISITVEAYSNENKPYKEDTIFYNCDVLISDNSPAYSGYEKLDLKFSIDVDFNGSDYTSRRDEILKVANDFTLNVNFYYFE